MDGIERKLGQPGNGGQAGDAFLAARRALVDLGLPLGQGLGIGAAVGVAAAGALGLRQRIEDALKQERAGLCHDE
jgi:hypothetical protein